MQTKLHHHYKPRGKKIALQVASALAIGSPCSKIPPPTLQICLRKQGCFFQIFFVNKAVATLVKMRTPPPQFGAQHALACSTLTQLIMCLCMYRTLPLPFALICCHFVYSGCLFKASLSMQHDITLETDFVNGEIYAD